MAIMDIGSEQPDNSAGAENARTLQRMQGFLDMVLAHAKNDSVKNVITRLVTSYWGKVEGDLDAYYAHLNRIIGDFLCLEYNSHEHQWRLMLDNENYTIIEIFDDRPSIYDRPQITITIPHASYKSDGLTRLLYAKATIAVTESFSDHIDRVHAAISRAHNGGR